MTFHEVARMPAIPVCPTSVTSTSTMSAGLAAVSTHNAAPLRTSTLAPGPSGRVRIA